MTYEVTILMTLGLTKGKDTRTATVNSTEATESSATNRNSKDGDIGR